jgi:hypothetical protein
VTAARFAAEIDGLAARHGVDRAGLAEALGCAELGYSGGPGSWASMGLGEDAPDDLDRLAARIAAVLNVPFDKEVNWVRLVARLAGPNDADGPSQERMDRIRAMSDRLYEMLRFLDEVRQAASEAHRPPRGRGRPAGELGAAYATLADFWRREKGAEQFTSGWRRSEPRSAAARFVFEAMQLVVGRDHPRLAQQIAALMRADIERLPGRRRGRPGLTVQIVGPDGRPLSAQELQELLPALPRRRARAVRTP